MEAPTTAAQAPPEQVLQSLAVDREIDEMADQFKDFSEQMRGSWVAKISQIKKKLMAQSAAMIENERKQHVIALARKQDEVELLKEAAQKEKDLCKKQKIYLWRAASLLDWRNTLRLQELLLARIMRAWREYARWHKRHRNMKAKIDELVRRHTLSRALTRWRSWTLSTSRVTLRDRWQAKFEQTRNELMNRYEAALQQMRAQLSQANELVRQEQQARAALHEDLRGAVLRGVCALNNEAITVLQRRIGVVATPAPPPVPLPPAAPNPPQPLPSPLLQSPAAPAAATAAPVPLHAGTGAALPDADLASALAAAFFGSPAGGGAVPPPVGQQTAPPTPPAPPPPPPTPPADEVPLLPAAVLPAPPGVPAAADAASSTAPASPRAGAAPAGAVTTEAGALASAGDAAVPTSQPTPRAPPRASPAPATPMPDASLAATTSRPIAVLAQQAASALFLQQQLQQAAPQLRASAGRLAPGLFSEQVCAGSSEGELRRGGNRELPPVGRPPLASASTSFSSSRPPPASPAAPPGGDDESLFDAGVAETCFATTASSGASSLPATVLPRLPRGHDPYAARPDARPSTGGAETVAFASSASSWGVAIGPHLPTAAAASSATPSFRPRAPPHTARATTTTAALSAAARSARARSAGRPCSPAGGVIAGLGPEEHTTRLSSSQRSRTPPRGWNPSTNVSREPRLCR